MIVKGLTPQYKSNLLSNHVMLMKFVVIDDDPTGSQTVHDCLLLLKWDCSTLVKGFESKSNLFFILANTRSLSENDAKLTICLLYTSPSPRDTA